MTREKPEKTENPNIVAGRKAIEAKDYKTAVGHLTKAVQEEPKNADAHNMLGYSYRKVGTVDKSMEHYQTALKLDSNHRSAHEYLGELYLDMNQPDNAEKQLASPVAGIRSSANAKSMRISKKRSMVTRRRKTQFSSTFNVRPVRRKDLLARVTDPSKLRMRDGVHFEL